MRAGFAACLLTWLCLTGGASAAPRLEVETAFDAGREGDMLPLRVSIENDGPSGVFVVSARAVTTSGLPSMESELELAEGARKTLWLVHQPMDGSVEVTLSQGGREIARRELHLKLHTWSQGLIGMLGSPPVRLLKQLATGEKPRPRATLAVTSVDRLPDNALLWPSLDQLLWPAPRAHELTGRQASALRTWVSEGGRLIAGTHPEAPQALATLGLLPSTATEGEHPLGWGRVRLVADDLSRANAATWIALIDLQAEPPSARVQGPTLLLQLADAKLENAVRPPFAAGLLLLPATLLGLIVLPWHQTRRARSGRALRTRSWRSSLGLISAATLIALLLAHFGAGRGLVVDRLDIIDVDVDGDLARSHSVVAVRRARAGALEFDTGGAGRLRVMDWWSWRRRARDHDRSQLLAGDASSSTARVESWESVRLDIRWRPEALALGDLQVPPEQLQRDLGAELAALKQGSSVEWLEDGEHQGAIGLRDAARWLGNHSNPRWQYPPEGPSQLMDWALTTVTPSQQWRWPANERWSSPAGEQVLLALVRGSQGPPLLVDGREVEAEAWTLWRVRLPRPAGNPS